MDRKYEVLKGFFMVRIIKIRARQAGPDFIKWFN